MKCTRFLELPPPGVRDQRGKGLRVVDTMIWTFCTVYRDDASGCRGVYDGCPFYTESPVADRPPTDTELRVANL